MNTWVRNSQIVHTLPRGHFAHLDRHPTFPRRSTEPSPYATSHLTDWNHPDHGKNRLDSAATAFLPVRNELLQQQAMLHPTDCAENINDFVFPISSNVQDTNCAGDGYDPPPRTHMIRNLVPESNNRDDGDSTA